jgi:6-phosphofructokinase 1
MAPRNILYAQSGGVTAVINASARGLIEAARQQSSLYPQRVGRVFAARNGILGALAEDLIDTSKESEQDIARLSSTPGGAFGSCRFKLKSFDTDRAQYERLIEVFRAHDIGMFFYNGGGDSADTCLKVSQLAERMGYPITAVHIPKTIDNDLPLTDTCPGFGSVAKYVATSMREAAFDVASMAASSTKVFVMEVMGRHAGWITAAVGLSADQDHSASPLLLFPERAFDETAFLDRVEESVRRDGYCTVGVSEGLADAEGKRLADSGRRDAFGHAQLGGVGPMIARLVEEKLKLKHHWAVADYLQRSARHLASRTDLEQAYAVGRDALFAALEGQNAVMVAIERLSDAPYRWQTRCVPLKDVANIERTLPDAFIREDGLGITQACRQYLSPLIEGESPPEYVAGLPFYVRLKNVPVEKKLPPFLV